MTVAFTGAGGKSSALAQLAREASGRFPLVLTTTTRLAASQRSLGDSHMVATTTEQARQLRIEPGRSLVVTGPEDEAEGKLLGLPPDVLAELARRCSEEGAVLAIEADGARGRLVKAPAPHEPVLPPWVDVVVPVAGLPVVGRPLDPATAHRPERIASLLGLPQGEVLNAEGFAALLTSREGGLRGVSGAAEVRVLLTGLDDVAAEIADEVRSRILAAPRVQAVMLGDPDKADPIRYADGRIAGVVLAAGAGERFGGPKQIAVWDGQPLIYHAVRAGQEGGLSPIVVVLGAHHDAVRAAVAGEKVILVDNPAWADGQSTSVHAGLWAVGRTVEAAVFLLADMPRVNSGTIDRLRDAHRSALPPIVAPVGGGRRGNPVLFDRRVFPALHALSGDEGGRSLLNRFPWQEVEVEPQEFVEVDRPEDLEGLGRGG
jgi:molybdenum cofactor cytidylyltransferase